jgi:hypothetical protein
MTEFFQSYLGAGLGWFVAHLILILLIALPVRRRQRVKRLCVLLFPNIQSRGRGFT